MRSLKNSLLKMRKAVIMLVMVFACFQLSTPTSAGLPVVDIALNASSDTYFIAEVAATVTEIANLVLTVAEVVVILSLGIGALEELGTILKLQVASVMNTQTNATNQNLASTGSESTLNAQLQNYNASQVSPGTDNNQGGLDYNTNGPVTYYGNSANSLIGGNDEYSTAHGEQAQNFVTNSSGGSVGIAKPKETWRQHTTPEAVQYNAYYNHVSANQSTSTNALSMFAASGSRNSDAGNKSVMSEVMYVLTYSKCDPTVDSRMSNVFTWLFCAIGNTGAVIPAVLYLAVNTVKSTTGLLGGINATGASALNFGVVQPMGKQAEDAAAGAQAKSIKKHSSS